MNDPLSPYDDQAPLRRAIESLLSVALPADLCVLAPGLVDRAAQRYHVALQADKRWGELSESEQNIVAREVGLVARDVIQRRVEGAPRVH